MRITRDIVEKPIVRSITNFCKSFNVYKTQFRAFAATVKCFNSVSLWGTGETTPSACTVYVSFAKMTALKTLCRHWRFSPCARNVFDATEHNYYVLGLHAHSCEGIGDRHSKDIYAVNTFGSWVVCFRRLSANMISNDFVPFNFRLLANDHCSMLRSSSCLSSTWKCWLLLTILEREMSRGDAKRGQCPSVCLFI